MYNNTKSQIKSIIDFNDIIDYYKLVKKIEALKPSLGNYLRYIAPYEDREKIRFYYSICLLKAFLWYLTPAGFDAWANIIMHLDIDSVCGCKDVYYDYR
jgi:hypothetical protein